MLSFNAPLPATAPPSPIHPPTHTHTHTHTHTAHPTALQAYYKLSHVDRRVDSPEQRVCEDVPKLCSGLADLTRELIVATGGRRRRGRVGTRRTWERCPRGCLACLVRCLPHLRGGKH